MQSHRYKKATRLAQQHNSRFAFGEAMLLSLLTSLSSICFNVISMSILSEEEVVIREIPELEKSW